ncbi:Uncharacterized protein BP5553_02126 [Venustampulla echinocandica]|uniref:TPR-like protein n=1 Tax=Venustampulla echinocandica TaxID=2656787 RepID=A0A370U2Z6_9HELO|nr:Uncharacterized protein BP5553_02126 [Venustampulla echinocandica]RDL42147.1 Uncharacterized protein BP5553_02126 [Venustampulla echinocandica]
MDPPTKEPKTTPQRHSRHGSSGRVDEISLAIFGNHAREMFKGTILTSFVAPIPRRPTRGPLDISDPAANPLSPTNLLHQSSSQILSPPTRYHTPRLPSPTPGSNLSTLSSVPSFKTAHSTLQSTQKDFSYLLRPEIYHPLALIDVPPPFRSPSVQPDPSTPIPELISAGHWRSAAIRAAQQLTAPTLSPSDHTAIFALIYTRLSCLTLCNQTPLAAQEVKCLEDLNSSYYRDDISGLPLVPWHLRVLAVRLQGMGYADARRGVMGYYDLAREARLTLTSLKKRLSEHNAKELETKGAIENEIIIWKERLHDLGIRVASALVEMEDLEGAARFLKTLRPSTSSDGALRLEAQKALLYLCLGDVDAARLCISPSGPTPGDPATGNEEERKKEQNIILALSHIADGNYDASAAIWEEFISSGAETAVYKQNLAVCHLYLGRMDDARTTLESLLTTPEGPNTFHALTFNLSTIYELCTERSRALKIGLAEKVAGILSKERTSGISGQGSEKVNGDFKL